MSSSSSSYNSNINSTIPPLPVGAFIPGGHGTDPPLAETDPTVGYKLNHFMLRIRDPKPTLHFYIDLMGMRTVFSMNAGPFTIFYLGYPQTEEHRADPAKFARETVPPAMTHTLGLLELYHLHGSEDDEKEFRISTGNTPPHLGFGHLGFTVPDVPAAVERLRKAGVKIVKELGVGTKESVPISKWEDEIGIATGELHANYKHIYEQIAFVEDPVS
jgi:lactoylglutathione lyase